MNIIYYEFMEIWNTFPCVKIGIIFMKMWSKWRMHDNILEWFLRMQWFLSSFVFFSPQKEFSCNRISRSNKWTSCLLVVVIFLSIEVANEGF